MDRAHPQRTLERVLLEHLGARGRDWAMATELAMEVGYPWRSVARALIRLSYEAHIEQRMHEWESNKQRMRRCFAYRCVVTAHAEYPAWLMPQAPAPQIKRIRGR